MTAIPDCHQLVSSFLAARQDPGADAIDLMDPAFSFESPLMRIDDRAAYVTNHRGFQSLVKGTRMISELYGTEEATLFYDLETAAPVGVQRTAEHIRFTRGRVVSIMMLFDSAPWRPIFESTER